MGTGSAKAGAHQDQGGGFEALEPGTSQSLVINSNTVQSSQFSAKTSIIRLFSTVDCFLAFGPNPAASSSGGYFLPGGIIDFVGVNNKPKLAVTWSASAGTLYITEGE